MQCGVGWLIFSVNAGESGTVDRSPNLCKLTNAGWVTQYLVITRWVRTSQRYWMCSKILHNCWLDNKIPHED